MGFFEILAIAILSTLLGISIAYLYGKKYSDFSWSKYALFMLGPVSSVTLWALLFNTKIIYLFLASSLVGMILEFSLGFVYQRVFQRKLWEYDEKAYAILGHTSLLTLPMWGCAGVVFWIVAKIVGV